MIRKLLVACSVVMLGLVGCDTTAGPNQSGKLSILLTDAPGDLLSAVVTIEKIYLQGSVEGDDESSRVYLLETPTTANLLDLQNEVLGLVDEATVPGGQYSQLRLVISGGYIEVVEEEDGGVPTVTTIYASSAEYAAAQGVTADGTLQMPSYATSGLKINLPGGSIEVDGDQQILLLDFNVAESFGKQAGQSGSWVMTPVIHASDFGSTVGVEFSLSLGDGVVLPDINGESIGLADFGASLTKGGDVLEETFEEKDGVYKVNFLFLDANTDYPVSFVEPEGLDVTLNPAFPTTVNVPSGTLRMSFVVTAAVPEAE
jgi:hypothetical protein